MPTNNQYDTKPTQEKRAEHRQFLKRQKEAAQLAAIESGVGFSSDKIVAIYLDASRSTIWQWAREGLLPRPVKITSQFSRWEPSQNKTNKQSRCAS